MIVKRLIRSSELKTLSTMFPEPETSHLSRNWKIGTGITVDLSGLQEVCKSKESLQDLITICTSGKEFPEVCIGKWKIT